MHLLAVIPLICKFLRCLRLSMLTKTQGQKKKQFRWISAGEEGKSNFIVTSPGGQHLTFQRS